MTGGGGDWGRGWDTEGQGLEEAEILGEKREQLRPGIEQRGRDVKYQLRLLVARESTPLKSRWRLGDAGTVGRLYLWAVSLV